MDSKVFVEKLYDLVGIENINIYKDVFDNAEVSKVTDSFNREAIEFYRKLSDEDKEVLLKILKQVGIDTMSNVLALLDGSTCLEGQDSDFILKFKNKDELINGDLQDLFLEYAEMMESQEKRQG